MYTLINKKTLYIFVLSLVLIFSLTFSCNSSSDGEENNVDVGLPPSLSGETVENTRQIVKLSDEQSKQLNIQTHTIGKQQIHYKIPIPAKAIPAPDRISIISAPISGRVASVYAHEGEYVKKNQLIMELESLEFANLVAEFLEAVANEDYHAVQMDRIENLVERNISPERALEKAETDLALSKALAHAAHARLLAIGVRESQITSWIAGTEYEARLKIYAPISGVISQHLIDLGQSVTGYEEMMTIINPDKVLIRGFAAPEEGAIIKPGDAVEITMKDFPELKIEATVTTVNPTLDEINKSISINVISPTKNNWPIPGQNVRLNISVKTPIPVFTIPLSSIEYEGDLPAVFIQHSATEFEKRFIKINRIAGDKVIVSEGLQIGEKVAVTQVFSLKALGKYEEFAE
jgi:cobalt-zinc-cadmium efflux system membrane fusion protein